MRLRQTSLNLFTFISLAVLAASILLMWAGWSELKVDSIGDDAAQNLRSALNLWQHGVYGESTAPLAAGYRREPFPNWLLAANLKWQLHSFPGISFEALIGSPELLKKSMAVNLLYLAGLFASLWGLCARLIRPPWLAACVSGLVIYYSYTAFAKGELGTLNTELAAAFLFVLSALTLLLVWQKQSRVMAGIAGVVLGALVLTKASGGYLILLLLPVLPWFLHRSRKQGVALALCLALGFALTVLPWMARNAIAFGKPAIAKGGGGVLLIRSSYNEMSGEEFWGAFYAYAPDIMRKELFEAHLGFSEAQLECGGSLQRLRRNLPCDEKEIEANQFSHLRSFYQRGKRTLPAQLREEAARQGKEANEDFLQAAALRRIRAAPLNHLLVSLPLSWRGLWSFENQQTWFGVVANASAMAALLVMPGLGLLLRRPEWLLISITGVAYLVFYGLFSHFITRYSEPLIPLALVCLSVLALEGFRWLCGHAAHWLSPKLTPG